MRSASRRPRQRHVTDSLNFIAENVDMLTPDQVLTFQRLKRHPSRFSHSQERDLSELVRAANPDPIRFGE